MFDFLKSVNNKILLGVGIAAVIAVMTGFWLWSQEPKYRVVFSNYSDKDGGAIVAALEQMNVPYRLADGGGAIMVPADQVYQVRLKLASMGLPKGGNTGFELLENQKFGTSQFVEQVNYQRALEGELERSIQAISAVDNARVHLAIPKSSVFVKDQSKSTASVLLRLQQGRTLDERQVSAIVHLVASSVPNLPITNVDVVDQNGNLLTDSAKKRGPGSLDPSQLKYIEELQKSIVARVEGIVGRIVGVKNVHVEANAEVDFASMEQAEELYKPNKTPEESAIRSMQSNESSAGAKSGGASGVPGALSNQPPANATAPVNGDAKAAPAAAGDAGSQKHTVMNYELDKTVRYSQKAMGGIKRLSVAVLVNDKQEVDKDGKVTTRPLTDEEKEKITQLAKEAMGFTEDRGDSVTLVNTSFNNVKEAPLEELPIWKDPENIHMAKDAGKLLLGLIVMFLLYKKALKPMVTKLLTPAPPVLTVDENESGPQNNGFQQSAGNAPQLAGQRGYEGNLMQAKTMAKENPKLVANVVTSWVSGNG